ncbi:uncharacterized protein LOC126919085 [Bombus affinis]|uniref:uncharacterized protein LOC126919085 n=1 Tax=Bombus affinis TaxID=309941 RepID=UPI0021B816A6|nr:uncharacterized protein LOC126919085 [Bombus affinis]
MIYTGLQRGTPLVQCGSPKAAKRILDDLHWTATWDTIGHHWFSVDLQMPRKEFWMIYTGLQRGTSLDTVGHRWTPLDIVGHRWTSLDTVGHRWTPLDTVGHRWTPLDDCRSPKNAKRILDDLDWTATWDTVGYHWFSVDLQKPRKEFWMIYTGLQRGTPLVQCGSPKAAKRILDDLHWTATWDTIGSVWISKCREKNFG